MNESKKSCWKIKWHRKANKRLKRLPSDVQDPYTGTPLHGEWSEKLRVGDHRIVYTLVGDLKLVLILKVGHRKDVYR